MGISPRWLALVAALALAPPARAERVLYASADGRGGYFNGQRIEADSLEIVLAHVKGRLPEKTVIQLLAADSAGAKTTVFRNERDPCNYTIARVEGSEKAPLVIRGIRQGERWITEIAGDSVDDIVAKNFSCQRAMALLREHLPSSARPMPPAPREEIATRLHRAAPSGQGSAMLGAGDQYRLVRCMQVVHSRHVAFENLHFKDCWVSAVYIADSSDVAVRGSFIEGSSYAIYATAVEEPVEAVRGFTIENNVWIQDTSGYGPEKPPPCRDVMASLDCPGLVWTSIPWAVTHETWYEHMNGGLFGSYDIGGGVVFRGNKVTNAYNGIRMVASFGCNQVKACREAANRDVEVVDNDFIYIRDNPVEAEQRAVNWTVARNRIRNAHAWFSFDDVAGGPIYIWGNTGWYTDIPGRDCREDPKHKQLMRVDFERGGYREIGGANEPASAFTCARSRFGTIVKEGSEGVALHKDIYVFNNSWYVRIPVVREAQAGRIKYWNNAMHFTGCGVSADPNSLCAIEMSAGIEDCRAYRDYLMDDGTSMLLRCIDAAQAADPRRYDFRFNVSNKGFPAAFLASPGRKDAVIAADPRFRAPAAGDFRLRSRSPAIGRGCIVEWEDRVHGTLRCRPPRAGEAKPDIGAYSRAGELYAGPQ